MNGPDTLARRIAGMNSLILQMQTMRNQLDAMRHSSLVGIATMCKVPGFDNLVMPLSADGVDLSICWEKKAKEPVTNAEREELSFRIQQVCQMGFKRVPLDEDNGHVLKFNFKVR